MRVLALIARRAAHLHVRQPERKAVAIRAYYRKDLALKQLETALQLYFEDGDRGSVITLAGAADEVFGKLLVAAGGETSLQSLIDAVTAIQTKLMGEADDAKYVAERTNRARNSLKHWGQATHKS